MSEQVEKILVVDDDARLRGLLQRFLEEQGYAVKAVADADQMDRALSREIYSLMVLDLMLPGEDGLSICRRLRDEENRLPIIMLTAKGDDAERIEGLDAGADDYLPKPFRMEELVARARALIRRSAGRGNPVQVQGKLSLDPARMEVSVSGKPVSVSALEYRLLSYLMLHRDRVLPVGELLEHLYGDEDSREANALEALVARLRRKLGPGVIGTRRGFGYFLEGGGS